MNFPNDFEADTQVIEADQLGPAGRLAIEKLAASDYEVRIGLTQAYAKDIIAMALEPGIKEFCPNDSGKRFKDIQATKDWLSKNRATFLLVQKNTQKLVGYGWVGAGTTSHVPAGQATFAIRVGQAGAGQGLATPFAQLIISGAALLYGATNMWLETWQSNGGAVHVYHKIGFVDVDSEADQRPSANGVVDDTRLYMSLDNDLLMS